MNVARPITRWDVERLERGKGLPDLESLHGVSTVEALDGVEAVTPPGPYATDDGGEYATLHVPTSAGHKPIQFL